VAGFPSSTVRAFHFRLLFLGALGALGGSVFPAFAQPVSVVDDRGKTVTLARPAQRIVALAPSLAELAFAAGAGGRLAGIARHSDYPPQVRKLPEIGDAARVEFERVAALKPDLILAWKSGNSPSDVERLERLGYPAFVSEPARLADIPRVRTQIGAGQPVLTMFTRASSMQSCLAGLGLTASVLDHGLFGG